MFFVSIIGFAFFMESIFKMQCQLFTISSLPVTVSPSGSLNAFIPGLNTFLHFIYHSAEFPLFFYLLNSSISLILSSIAYLFFHFFHSFLRFSYLSAVFRVLRFIGIFLPANGNFLRVPMMKFRSTLSFFFILKLQLLIHNSEKPILIGK